MRSLPRYAVRLVVSVCIGLIAARPAGAGLDSCAGDCNGDRIVTVDELVRGVNLALEQQAVEACPAFDRNADARVTIDELLAAVAAAIGSCPAPPTVTGTIIEEATSTPTATGTVLATAAETAEPTRTAEPTDTEGPTATPTATPAGSTSALTAVIDGDQVRLAWTNPDPAGGYTRALVLRRLNAPVEGPEDPQAVLVFLDSGAMATHPLSDLAPGAPGQPNVYHYAVFPCTATFECGADGAATTLALEVATVTPTSPPDATATATPADTGTPTPLPTDTAEPTDTATALPSASDSPSPTPTATPAGIPPGPSGLTASVEQTHVRLGWVNAPAYPKIRLLRRLNAAVDGPHDPGAQLLYAGSGDMLLDPLSALLPTTPTETRAYHYAVYGCVGSSCEDVGSHTTVSPSIGEALRAGGYAIFWRHATAFTCQDRTELGTAAETEAPDWWKSCDATCTVVNVTATARQLSEAGRDEAMTIGVAFDRRHIPVGRVLASEFCRARETAALMDFGPPIETRPELTYFVYDEANRCADTFALLHEAPVLGTNTALIGHGGNTCPPLSLLPMAAAAIFKPNGAADPIFIGTVSANDWATLP